MASTLIKGLVVKKTDYQVYDEIITIYTKDGFISFIALGVRKIQSKNRVALQLGNLVECEIFLARFKNTISKLKKAQIIFQVDITDTQIREFIIDLIFLVFKLDDNRYFFYIENLDKQLAFKEYVALKLWHMAKMLYFLGYQQKIDGCSICNTKKNIASFNLHSGGLLCIYHLSNNKNYEKGAIQLFIILNKLKIEEFLRVFDKKYLPLLYTHYKNFYSQI